MTRLKGGHGESKIFHDLSKGLSLHFHLGAFKFIWFSLVDVGPISIFIYTQTHYNSVMKLNWRKWHRWISIIIVVPFLVTLVTGLLLASRGFNSWVQPSYPPVKKALRISFAEILKAAQSFPQAEISSWEDISQIDIRPGTGNIRVRSKKTQWELQIDGETGQILGQGIRRASLLTSLHEGAYFGPYVRYGVFFVSAWGVLFLTVSGLIIFLQSSRKKRK